MKRVSLFFISLIFVVASLNFGCNFSNSPTRMAVQGLDLKALGELAKNSQTAEHFEQKLNEPDGINNVDLNEDGVIDFLKVTEYGDSASAFGFSITTEVGEDQIQEIAKVEIENESVDAQTARVQVEGDSELYGSNRYESSTFSLTEVLILHYLLSSHTAYSSPYRYGNYPNYYTRSPTRTADVYRSRVKTAETNFKSSQKSTMQTSVKSPNAGKSVPSVSRTSGGATKPSSVSTSKPSTSAPTKSAPAPRAPSAPSGKR